MKLKNMLMSAFLMLTLIPIAIVSLLLYKSGYALAKESYIRNLTESISVQSDYIVQTMDSNMITDYRFAQQDRGLSGKRNNVQEAEDEEIHAVFQTYLESLGDRITVCLLLDKDNNSMYTIGDTRIVNSVMANLPSPPEPGKQTIAEFEIEPGTYSLGIVTPMQDAGGAYSGCLISVYDPAYLFKIISSYYKVADTSTYICRSDGDVIRFRGPSDERQNSAIENALIELTFTTEGVIDMRSENVPISGYYKNIGSSPWFLVGFIDDKMVNSFTSQYVLVYIFIIFGVMIIDVVLVFYFSRKVVDPINSLIQVMEGYPDNLNGSGIKVPEIKGYYETSYLRTRFLELMKRILLVQHNFEGIYQLYQSGNMSDTNIDIDTREQTISSNKSVFQKLMNELEVSPDACIVERFINCFCQEDQKVLMDIFVNMRDRHLAVPCEVEIYTPHLEKKWFHTLVVPMYENESLSHLFIQLRDISAFKRQEYETNEGARRDSLTGLYNRSGFIYYVNKALKANAVSALHGLLFIDMDYFKMVNDNLGHSEGDHLLCSVGRVLSETVSPAGIVSRYGGDEFAVFLPDISEETVIQIKESLHDRLVYPYQTKNVNFVVTASIGISFWSRESPSALEELLSQADSAMYAAKKRVKENKENEE